MYFVSAAILFLAYFIITAVVGFAISKEKIKWNCPNKTSFLSISENLSSSVRSLLHLLIGRRVCGMMLELQISVLPMAVLTPSPLGLEGVLCCLLLSGRGTDQKGVLSVAFWTLAGTVAVGHTAWRLAVREWKEEPCWSRFPGWPEQTEETHQQWHVSPSTQALGIGPHTYFSRMWAYMAAAYMCTYMWAPTHWGLEVEVFMCMILHNACVWIYMFVWSACAWVRAYM